MEFTYLVTATLERTEGKFATRDELEEQVREAITDADPGSLDGDEGGSYDVQDWDVQEAPSAADFRKLGQLLVDAANHVQRLHPHTTQLEQRLRKAAQEFRITAPPARTGPTKREREQAARIHNLVDTKAKQRGSAAPGLVCPTCSEPLKDLGASTLDSPHHIGLCKAHGHWYFMPAVVGSAVAVKA